MKTPTWLPLKQWLADEALREGVCPHAIWQRVNRGKQHRKHYRNLKVRHVNKRVVLVRV